MGLVRNVIWFVLNVIWFITTGLSCALVWFLAGCLMFVTIIGEPFSFAAFRIASFAAWPFGRAIVPTELVGENRVSGTALPNILWIVLAGLWLSLSHALAGFVCCITIILIPFGLQHFRLAELSLRPLGYEIVSKKTGGPAREGGPENKA